MPFPFSPVRSSVRARSIAVLSLAAAAALVFSGCAAGDTPDAPSETTAAADGLCESVAAPGAATDSVIVEGEPGTLSTAMFDAPLEIDVLQSTVIAEGSGEAVAEGDFVTYALSAFNAETGESLADIGYEPGQLMPVQISPQNPLGQLLGCAKPGARVVAAFPASETVAAEVYIVDLLDTVPLSAWGEQQDAVAGMPEVELADDGAPSVTIPEGDLPTETQVAVLKEGDGYVVESGDAVLIQYYGVRWSNGESFDSTWANGGVPYSSLSTQFIPGFQKALDGHAVGSQVLVVIPPAEGYGEGEVNEEDLVGETLVFVVDILGAQSVAAAQ